MKTPLRSSSGIAINRKNALAVLCVHTALFAQAQIPLQSPRPQQKTSPYQLQVPKTQKADLRIDLPGVALPQARFLLDRTVYQTIDFVDEKHLLVTSPVKELLPRIVDDPETDEDRVVKAQLIELPSGTVVGETKWRLHDGWRYLWRLGRGQFLLRIRGRLSTFFPLEALKADKPFVDNELLIAEGAFKGIGVSPDGTFLQIEMQEQPDPLKGDPGKLKQRLKTKAIFAEQVEKDGSIVYQVRGDADFAGAASIPMLSAGLLDLVREDSQHWGFEWRPYGGGQVVDLAGLETSCPPVAAFVSGFEFIGLGCRGDVAHSEIGAFNLEGKALWVMVLAGDSNSPALKTAARAGRFAYSRLLSIMGSGPSSNTPETVQGQEIQVYQTSSGRPLAKILAVPPQQAGLNFDLSPDGSRLAVAEGRTIEIFNLPQPTAQEKKDLQHALSAAPRPVEARIHLTSGDGDK